MSVKYICDRCGREIPKNERFEVRVSAKGSPTFYHPTDWGDKDLCQSCADRIVRMTFAKVAAVNQEFEAAVAEMMTESKPMPESEVPPEPEPEPKPESPKKNKKKASVDIPFSLLNPPKKKNTISSDEADKIRQMYSEGGLEIEQISDKLLIEMSVISRLVAAEGLGELRYGKAKTEVSE